MSEPLISCVCPTMVGRKDHLKRAIDCFLAQTYPNREMLIVYDGPFGFSGGPWEAGDEQHPNIRIAVAPTQAAIGAKRNYCGVLAQGEYIAHFDDDDWSAADRLEHQLELVRQSGKAVTAYHSVAFTNGEAWWQHAGAPDVGVGLSLFYRRAYWQQNPFSATTQLGEDSGFLGMAAHHGQLRLEPAGSHIFGSIHAGNTSCRYTTGPSWKRLAGPPAGAPDGWLKAA